MNYFVVTHYNKDCIIEMYIVKTKDKDYAPTHEDIIKTLKFEFNPETEFLTFKKIKHSQIPMVQK